MHSHQGPGTETNQDKGKKIILPKDTSVLQGSVWLTAIELEKKFVCVEVCVLYWRHTNTDQTLRLRLKEENQGHIP